MIVETKIEITRRLQLAGQWEAASAFKEECRRRLRAEKIPRGEANERAWDEMRRRYPPLGSQHEQPATLADVASVDADDEPAQTPLESLRSKLTGPITLDVAAELAWAIDVTDDATASYHNAPTLGAWIILQSLRHDHTWDEVADDHPLEELAALCEQEDAALKASLALSRSCNPVERVQAEVSCLLRELEGRYGFSVPTPVGEAIGQALLMHVVPVEADCPVLG
jgi:hypothetical protein